jgi:hypothetical protein
VVAEHGLTANPGTGDAHDGYVLHVVQGMGRGVDVWSQNMPLSSRESVARAGQEARIDPTQYFVTVSRRNPFRANEVPAVTEELKAGLRANGYEIRLEPRTCDTDTG